MIELSPIDSFDPRVGIMETRLRDLPEQVFGMLAPHLTPDLIESILAQAGPLRQRHERGIGRRAPGGQQHAFTYEDI
jgi:hypothetical protein